MNRDQLESECKALKVFFKEKLQHPLPYEEARAVRRALGDDFIELIPDLSSYHSEIAACCSWGKRMLNWNAEQRATAREACSSSFFAAYPVYAKLEGRLAEFPALKREFELYESASKRILAVVSRIEETLI